MNPDASTPPDKKIGIGLGIGIFFLPLIFAWFLLKKGYSTTARALGFTWMGLTLIAGIASPSNPPSVAPTNTNIAPQPKVQAPPPEPPKSSRQENIENQFSAWDGSHRNLERYIKKIMNDPDSYKHVETRYWDMTTHLVVQTTFRGKNAFGAVIVNRIKAKVSLDGQVLEIIDQQ